MEDSKFLISTVTGQIPNIIKNSKIESLKGDLILYLDDFLYKDSIYDTEGCEISLKELCAIDENKKILLAFRNTPKVLSSKRGNYKLTKEKFLKVLNIMKPDYYVDFTTQKMINFKDKSEIDGKFVDPKTPEEFYNLTKEKKYFYRYKFCKRVD
ncbi:hypothetical protein NBO_10g0037 [Nosema bombycis CQ1]|uniref:Uncharacterized protein n=1 Tax=Nosema bombycis (strain CQ1 / CVCC 102059) TaxID=578461 RepID=R0KXV6_NOSB1|nr:hypothetical protein NBO_10g0037 [Nosema bombycis CQ1]|eukprot:EOB15047.1 hypothetical protein NBO_10g0037 [Nosema bombycis CQ1]